MQVAILFILSNPHCGIALDEIICIKRITNAVEIKQTLNLDFSQNYRFEENSAVYPDLIQFSRCGLTALLRYPDGHAHLDSRLMQVRLCSRSK